MSKKTMGIGAGLIAAAAAGAYFLYGADGAKNRKKVKGWMLKAKGEVLERLEDLQTVSEDAYHRAVEEVTARYRKMKDVDPQELAALGAELKRYWTMMRPKPAKRVTVKKTTKRTTRRS